MRLKIKKKILMKIERKHKIKLNEIYEVLEGRFYYEKIKGNRYKIIGKTESGRFVTLFVDKLRTFELVTARDSTDVEKRLYKKKVG